MSIQDEGKTFEIVVPVDGKTVRLQPDLNPFSLHLVDFGSTTRESVEAYPHAGRYYFQVAKVPRGRGKRSKARPAVYRWIAELKPAHAQRLAQKFTEKMGRIGLDESEWLRRSAK